MNIQDGLSLNLKIKWFLDKDNSERDLRQAMSLSPRIKLTICVYPMATGLDNYNLTHQSKFNKKTGELINSFLALLPSPACLVAHNGKFNAYDFPLLKAELESQEQSLTPKSYVWILMLGLRRFFMFWDFYFVEV